MSRLFLPRNIEGGNGRAGSLLGRREGGAAWTVQLAHVEKVKWYHLILVVPHT
jgi:hypothetical protein